MLQLLRKLFKLTKTLALFYRNYLSCLFLQSQNFRPIHWKHSDQSYCLVNITNEQCLNFTNNYINQFLMVDSVITHFKHIYIYKRKYFNISVRATNFYFLFYTFFVSFKNVMGATRTKILHQYQNFKLLCSMLPEVQKIFNITAWKWPLHHIGQFRQFLNISYATYNKEHKN